jgi:hypothetical protein
MRAAFEVGLLLGLVGFSAAFAASGCDHDCTDRFGNLLCGAASSGSTGGVSEECDPTVNPVPVADSCGVFVRTAGDDTKAGTKSEPVKTIAKAIERWKTRPTTDGGGKSGVYVCAEEVSELSTVALPAGLVMFGSLDCNAAGEKAWMYVPPGEAASETVITAPEGTVPLRILPSAGMNTVTTLTDVHVIAKTVPDIMPGVSSIAVIAEGANVEFVRSVLETGDGAKGEDGEPYDMMAQAGTPGNNGIAACDSGALSETDGPMGMCAADVVSNGGVGAAGGVSSAGLSTAGTPGADNAGTSESMSGPCTAGKDGSSPDAAATGEPVTGLGMLDKTVGYIGVPGNSGQPGAIGQGGGGGGGTRSKPGMTNLCGTGPGASGGSGGTGGCGGAGGRPGQPGGSSIAVVSLNSAIKLTETRVRVGNGGAPGLGGPGQTGGSGGMGGTGGAAKMNVAAGCNGGTGGKGGDGGAGSDGLGGHAVGIAFTDREPDLGEGAIIESLGDPGAGGQSAPTLQIPAAK